MLFLTIVLDGVGFGAQPDAAAYGDEGSNTLLHVCAHSHPRLPNLTRLGLGCVGYLPGVPKVNDALGSYGRMAEASAGKDSTTGHWELAGLLLEDPFPTYPDGFPPEVIDAFLHLAGCAGVLGNKAASGTDILTELGARHQETGFPIVYTSADSVFQVAAHVETIPLEELYRLCHVAREAVCTGEHAVGRVIARPFEGAPGAYRRLSAKRKDLALPPPGPVLQEALQQHGVRTISIGKVADLFAGAGFHEAVKTRSNEEGMAETLRLVQALGAEHRPAFIWTNLVDFDQEYGHRNDPVGFARALEAFDGFIPDLLDALPPGARLAITADHGNDPTTPGTDHCREYVPLLYYGGEVHDLGTRATFRDHAATVAGYFGVPFASGGTPYEQPTPDPNL